MQLKKILGKNIQTIRKEKKLTQEHFAELIGIDPKNVSKIENGINYPAAETLMYIAKALNVPVYELFVCEETIDYDYMKKEIINSLDNNQTIIYLFKQLKGIR